MQLPDGREIRCLNRVEVDFLWEEIFSQQVYGQHGCTPVDGDCVVDVGANIGLYSLWANCQASGLRIHALEPIPEIFAVLEQNASRHCPGARPHRIALGAQAATTRFTYYPHASGWSTRYPAPETVRESLRKWLLKRRSIHPVAAWLARFPRLFTLTSAWMLRSVERECAVATLSDFIRTREIEQINVLKIDVEAGELEVLAGIADEDWPRIDRITLETDAGRMDDIAALLRARAFDVIAEQPEILHGTDLWLVYARRT